MTDHDYLYTLVTAGNSGVGKTSILERYINDNFEENFSTTIGVDLYSKRIKFKKQQEDINFKINFWDIAGGNYLNAIVSTYFRNVDGFILVFDITNRESFLSLSEWIRKIKHGNPNNDKVQIVLIANKCDITKGLHQVTDEEIYSFIEKHVDNICKFYKTSARTSKNIEKTFMELISSVYETYEIYGLNKTKTPSFKYKSNSIKLENEKNNFQKLSLRAELAPKVFSFCCGYR